MEEEMAEELEAMRVAFTRSISTSGKSTRMLISNIRESACGGP
jgi:predicted DNA-binding protein (UPF0251 family)